MLKGIHKASTQVGMALTSFRRWCRENPKLGTPAAERPKRWSSYQIDLIEAVHRGVYSLSEAEQLWQIEQQTWRPQKDRIGAVA